MSAMSESESMAAAVKAGRAEILNRLPMVTWDRCVRPGNGQLIAFGWIERSDGQRDFVLIAFQWSDEPWICNVWTSSAEHSAEISRIFQGDQTAEEFHPHGRPHVDCERIADVFGDLVANRIGAV